MRLLVVVAGATVGTAWAEAGVAQEGDDFAQAELAYQTPDYEATLRLADRALRAGSHTRRRLVRLYELIGLSAAALGDTARARDAYLKMLLIEPSQQVGDDLAPRLRDPFLEARGQRAALRGSLGVEVSAVRGGRALRVAIGDPARMADEVVIGVRAPGDAAFTVIRRPSAEDLVVLLPEALATSERVEHWAQLVDAHDNRLVEIGSADDPAALVLRAPAEALTPAPPRAPDDDSILASPWLWIVGGAVIAAGVVTTVLLVDAASERDARFSVTF